MAKQYTSTEPKQDEFSKIFSDYRAKIEEITRRTEKNLNSIEAKPVEVQPIEAKFIENQADEDEHIEVVTAPPRPEAAIDSNIQAQLENVFLQNIEPAFKPEVVESAGEIFAGITLIPRKEPAQKPEAVNTLVDGVRPAFEGSDEILNQARREAKQIIEEAEESAKKKARKRTQSQVDKFIEKARKEAEEIIARANKDAETVRKDIIAESKHKADLFITEITDKCRQETEAKSSQAIAEAQGKADNMLADISGSTMQIGTHITGIVNRAKQTINELETTLQTEVTELNKIITETQNRLEEASKALKKE